MWIDSHAHLSSEVVLPMIEGIMERARKMGIRKIVNICTDAKTLLAGFRLAAMYPEICNAGSTTPHDVEREGEEMFLQFASAARSGNLVAIGETGLDYHYERSTRKFQHFFLEKYLELAQECGLPVIFHCREAFSDLFAVTDACYRGRAVLHCFTGTMEEAEGVLDRGWYLSFSGIVTYKKSQALRDIAKVVPLSQILLETDTPYLADRKSVV